LLDKLIADYLNQLVEAACNTIKSRNRFVLKSNPQVRVWTSFSSYLWCTFQKCSNQFNTSVY